MQHLKGLKQTQCSPETITYGQSCLI